MNMKQALYFKTIAKYGTITAAAKQLYISQPSLSQTLRQIEDEAGTPLFDRSTSPFHLTYAGERYLRAVEAMLEIETQLKEEIESIRRDDGGRLRLGISVTRAMQVMPDVIPIFTKAYPNVTIELTEAASASLEGLLQKGQVDLALAALEANEANIAYELIEKESIGILAGRDSQLAQLVPSGTPISLETVEKEMFVSLDSSHSSRIIQDRLFRRYNIRPKILLETSALEVARRVALKGGACMVLPDVYADDFVFESGGAFYPLKDYENHRHFYACYRNDENTKKYIRDFVSITASVLAHSTHGKRISQK